MRRVSLQLQPLENRDLCATFTWMGGTIGAVKNWGEAQNWSLNGGMNRQPAGGAIPDGGSDDVVLGASATADLELDGQLRSIEHLIVESKFANKLVLKKTLFVDGGRLDTPAGFVEQIRIGREEKGTVTFIIAPFIPPAHSTRAMTTNC